MENLESSKFDEEWKEAFEGAEFAPSKAVWSGLDQELTRAEGNSMRRSVIFYQRLAAACVLFALAAGTFGVYHWNENQKQLSKNEGKNLNPSSLVKKNDLADEQNKNIISNEANKMESVDRTKLKKSENITSTKKSGEFASANKIDSRKLKKERENDSQSTEKQSEFNKITSDTNNVVLMQSEDSKQPIIDVAKNVENKEPYLANINLNLGELSELPGVELKGKPVYVEIIRILPAISPMFMNDYRDEKINHEKLWASVTAAAGTFSNYNGGSSYSAANSSGSSSPSGSSYTMGMIGGVRVAKRWVLQSGVQYMNQSAGYVSNISGTSLNAVSKYAGNPAMYSNVGASTGFYGSSPYNIVSTNEFVTVPVQAGYLLVDRKLGWQVNPGLATDFFVRNTLSDPSGQRQSYSQSAGSDSPYRSVNFAGLMSSEVSYKLGKSYRVSLVPGFRYSFNPVLKSQTSGNPLVWDVAFRFRYIFK